jgi:hypothetical protein
MRLHGKVLGHPHRTNGSRINLAERLRLARDRLDTPFQNPANTNTTGKIVAIPEVGGLHHRYERLAA